MDTLDSNLLQRAYSAAKSDLVDPQQLARLPPEAFGAGDIRLALVNANSTFTTNINIDDAITEGTESFIALSIIDRVKVRQSRLGVCDSRLLLRYIPAHAHQFFAMLAGNLR